MELTRAHKIAVGICYLLQPHCEPERIRIAGSIRRRKPDVKDIELVCLPKIVYPPAVVDLFGGETAIGKPQVNKEFETIVNNLGTLESGNPATGKYCKILLPQDIKLDLFLPDPWDYFRQFAIRTGSADYAARMIAGGWTKKGWCGTDKGLRRQKDCFKKEYQDPAGKVHVTWKVVNEEGERPPVWESEQDFFKWLGVDYLEPSARFFT